MRFVFLLSLFCLVINSYAQPPNYRNYKRPFDFEADVVKSRNIDFKEDSITINRNSKYDSMLDLHYSLYKTYDFQFRLWKHHLEENLDNVFVLAIKNNRWTARYFDRNNGNLKEAMFTERKVDQSAIDQLWELLVASNVLTLPSQESIESKLVKYVVDTTTLPYPSIGKLSTTDGTLYGFELLSPTKKRYYSYGNPKAYLDHYSNVEELFNAVPSLCLLKSFWDNP